MVLVTLPDNDAAPETLSLTSINFSNIYNRTNVKFIPDFAVNKVLNSFAKEGTVELQCGKPIFLLGLSKMKVSIFLLMSLFQLSWQRKTSLHP
jgi:hypothetical protein